MRSKVPQCWVAFGALLLANLLSGCLVLPVPAPERTSAPPEIKKIDLSFLHAGTTREELQEKLGWSDTGIDVENAFVGRWSRSTSTTLWMVGGQGGGAAGGDRNWHTKTLVVRFDDNNAVNSWKFVPDRRLVAELEAIAKSNGRAKSFDTPVELQLLHWNFKAAGRHSVTVVLHGDTLKFKEEDGQEVEITRDKIVGFSIPKWLKSEEQISQVLNFAMHLSGESAVGKDLSFCGDVSELMTLVEFRLSHQ